MQTYQIKLKTNPQSWYALVPKVELHIHLEGAIPLESLWTLIQKYGGDAEVPDIDFLEKRFIYRDFGHFLETWVWKNQFLREYEDFTFIAEAVGRDLASQNIRYAEVHYSPADFFRYSLQVQELTQAIRRGLNRVPAIEIGLIADMVRNYGPEAAARLLPKLVEVRDQGVIGIGLGGSEQEFPPELFSEVYEQARQAGFHTTAHAGEVAGPASIWGALQSLQVERVGHGTRAIEDDRLLETLAKRRIPLEMCPLSNVRTGAVQSLREHPVRKYFDRGLLLSLNTDDPKMFGNSLAMELQLLEEELDFTRAELQRLILGGILSSWLPAERKKQLAADFIRHPNWG